jgi:Lactonase, 7-bladed beta-propeller
VELPAQAAVGEPALVAGASFVGSWRVVKATGVDRVQQWGVGIGESGWKARGFAGSPSCPPATWTLGVAPHGLGFRLGARALVAVLLALASAVPAQPAVASNDGSLERLKGKAGCLSVAARHGCARARALDAPSGVAVSPGGGSVYVASRGSDAVAVFRRSSRRGALRQLRGRAGCRRHGGGRGCGRARALRDPSAIVASPDGRFMYVGSSQAIAVFGRNRRTGALRQLRGRAGCVRDRPGAGCGDGRALAAVSSLALGPGGRFL